MQVGPTVSVCALVPRAKANGKAYGGFCLKAQGVATLTLLTATVPNAWNSEDSFRNFCHRLVVSVSPSLSSSCSQSRKFSSQSTARFFLDIFSGASMPVSTAVQELAGDRVEPVDLIHGLNLFVDDI